MGESVRNRLSLSLLVGGGLIAATPMVSRAVSAQNIQTVLNETHAKYRTLQEGENADYIPALAKVDPEHVRHCAGHGGRQGLHSR